MKTFSTLFASLALVAAAWIAAPTTASAAVALNLAFDDPAPETKPEAPKADEKKDAKDSKDSKDSKDAKKDEEKKPAGKKLTGVPTRVAILNFGLPQSAQGRAEDMVGREVNAYAWKQVIPKLEKAKVDVVVVRINSGGGALNEMAPFQRLYQNEYKKRFRTVAWIENAISCAAMSPWPLKEMYFLPEGRIGGCTAFNGGSLQQIPRDRLEFLLAEMEEVSRWADRDPKIMRSMQILEPLSANVDENGNAKFFQDLSGKIILNPAGEILTLTAPQALAVGFSSGTAATPEELMKAMGISEYEFVAKDASDFIDKNIIDCDTATKRFREYQAQYGLARGAAEQFRGDPARQDAAIGRARQALRKMQDTGRINPNLPMFNNLDDAWFQEQERELKELQKR
jgi:hypothetical protein